MESDKKKRRSANDLYPVLEKRRNTFYDYAYAGNPEIMVKLFKDKDHDKEGKKSPKKVDGEYFFKIPMQIFDDPDIIRKYGEEVLNARTERNFTQGKVAELFEIDHDAISKIEGGALKKIDRNILVLLCGLFRMPPEDLLGLNHCEEPPKESAMTFDSSEVAGKPQFIVGHLIEQEPDLLRAFVGLASAPKKKQEKLVNFLQNVPKIKILAPEKMTDLIKFPFRRLHTDGSKNKLGKEFFEYMDILGDLGTSNINLLDVFVSIAAMDAQIYPDVLTLLSCAGFWTPAK